MEKLSELIAYYRSLDVTNINEIEDVVKQVNSSLLSKLSNQHELDFEPILAADRALHKAIRKLSTGLEDHKQEVEKLIAQKEPEYFQLSYQIYEEMCNDTPEWILNRTNPLGDDNTEELTGRLKLHSSWTYPAMYIRPGRQDFIEDLVDCDPMYIVDQNHELLEPVKEKWNNEYQARLRYKVINENSDNRFGQFPREQFGLIVATHFFNFKPLEVIKSYLMDFLTLLRPGGVVVFTYNNCDYPGFVRNVENHFNCYTPGHLLKSFVTSLGYELINSVESASGYNWIEVKKPGKLTTLRGGQALAKIIKQPEDKI